MKFERVMVSLSASFFLLLCATTSAKTQESLSDLSSSNELACMRECMPTCTASYKDNTASCERDCKQRCGITNTFELRELRRILPSLDDLTGVIGPSFITICGGAACVCNGVSSCDSLIAACPADRVLQCNKYNEKGQPTACSCVRIK